MTQESEQAAEVGPRAAPAQDADGLPAPPPVRPGYYRGADYRPDESVGLLMRQVVDILARTLDARMAEHGLTAAQWRPLLTLSYHCDATATMLARKMSCDTGATTRMLDRLEDKGLLRRTRSTNDRRVQQIELTDEGRKAVSVIPYVIADVLNAALAPLSRAEVDQLRDMLRRMLEAGRREAGDIKESEQRP